MTDPKQDAITPEREVTAPEQQADETFADAQTGSEGTADPIATNEPVTEPTAQKKGSSAQVIILSVVAAVVLILGALAFTNVISLPGSSDNNAMVSSLEGFGPNDAIARVNGRAITRTEYDQQYRQTMAVLNSMGGSEQMNDPAFSTQLRESLVNDLVNAELLYQAGLGAGIDVTDEEVEAEYVATQEQVGGAEALSTQLAVIGLNESSLRTLIRRQMVIEEHLDAHLDFRNIAISESEIKAFYDEFVTGENVPEGTEAPELEDVSSQIEQQLAQERSTELVEGYLAQLREAAEVEVLI